MNWRTLGDVPRTIWQAELEAVDSPLIDELAETYAAARGHSRLILAILKRESRYGTHFNRNRASNRNAANLRPPLRPDGTREPGDYMGFGSWAAGIAALRERITSATYGAGIYARTTTIAELIEVFAPPGDDNDTAGYIRDVETLVSRWPEEDTVADLQFGNVPHPPYTRKIVPKAGNGHGFYFGAPRKIVGTCQHRTLGMGTNEGIYNLFAVGGERANDALTDYCIDLAGNIMMLNDPWGIRIPWANGGSDGLEGDGPNFVREFGIDGINGSLASIEHIGLQETPFEGLQFERSAQLTAHIHDKAKSPFDSFPLNPLYAVVTDTHHFEFATKQCPFGAFRRRTNDHQNRVRAILKAAQTKLPAEPETPPVKPVEPGHGAWPHGWTADELATVFGVLVRHNPKGSTTNVTFDGTPGHGAQKVISAAWAARAGKHFKKASNAPRPLGWYVLEGDEQVKQDLILFERDWALWRPDPAVAWTWIR